MRQHALTLGRPWLVMTKCVCMLGIVSSIFMQPAQAESSAGGTITPALDAVMTATTPPTSGAAATASDQPAKSREWQHGPHKLGLLDQAQIDLPKDYVYLSGKQAQEMLRESGNPNVSDVQAVITGAGRDWLVVVRFEKSGYIRETDAHNWNNDALLASIRNGSEASNKERNKQGTGELEVLGWLELPNYDPRGHRLTWGIAVRDQADPGTNGTALNYNSFLLGREGYVTINLVTSLSQIDKNRPHVDRLLEAFSFAEGKHYTEYISGKDAVAPYGLSALMSNATNDKQHKVDVSQKPGTSSAGKIIGIVLGVLVLLGGAGGGGWYWWRKKKQAAPTEALEPALPTDEANPATPPAA